MQMKQVRNLEKTIGYLKKEEKERKKERKVHFLLLHLSREKNKQKIEQ